jgi:beta-glucosidase
VRALIAWTLLSAVALLPAQQAHPAPAAAPPASETRVAPDARRPWLDARRPAAERARLALAAMTLEEEIGLLHAPSPLDRRNPAGETGVSASALIPSAGFVQGVPRLGIPMLTETDASLGVVNPAGLRPGDRATAFAAGLALASSFDVALAARIGRAIGEEAHAKGFNVLLGGGMDLARDPRNGRNFEYLGEDPLLAGLLAGAAVSGTQSAHVISTLKHYVLNANETNRTTLDARIERAALRESDLLAFEVAIERGRPGSIMCAYNLVNGAYSCGNEWLLDEVLKRDWRYPGWVMSDWGATHGVEDALAGLDQESGEQQDPVVWFNRPLAAAVAAGRVPRARIDDMALRIVRAMFEVGVVDDPPVRGAPIDTAGHAALALEEAREGVVLLKNEGGVLPLSAAIKRIAVIGGDADLGVMSGGGSAEVLPSNGEYVQIPAGPHGERVRHYTEILDPSPPVRAIERAVPGAQVRFDPGRFPESAAALAGPCDVALVFVTRHEAEGYDDADMELSASQNALIRAVAAANPRTIVILETGNPVAMPWIDSVAGVLEAWFPGQEGGRAIAEVLTGTVNPSGRLPITFWRSSADLMRPTLPNLGAAPDARVSIDYTESAEVGYRGQAARRVVPLFAFGSGLSYTHFEYGSLEVRGGRTLEARFEVRNVGARAGADVPQLYLTSAAGRPVLRLVAFERVALGAGESREVLLKADPRWLGHFDEPRRRWVVPGGRYRVVLGHSAADLSSGGEAVIVAGSLPP